MNYKPFSSVLGRVCPASTFCIPDGLNNTYFGPVGSYCLSCDGSEPEINVPRSLMCCSHQYWILVILSILIYLWNLSSRMICLVLLSLDTDLFAGGNAKAVFLTFPLGSCFLCPLLLVFHE
jgi:hypothetical protein